MLAKLLITSGLASAGLLLVIVLSITPKNGGAGAILAIFLLSYISLLSVITLALWLLSRFFYRLVGMLNVHYRQLPLSLKKSYYYSTIIALGPVIVIGLQSVGEVGLYEIGLIFVFMLLGCIYVAKRSG